MRYVLTMGLGDGCWGNFEDLSESKTVKTITGFMRLLKARRDNYEYLEVKAYESDDADKADYDIIDSYSKD